MTPLVQEMVSIEPDVAVDFHWFDVTSCYVEQCEINPETLELSLPFQKTALVWQQPDGIKVMVVCVQLEKAVTAYGFLMSDKGYEKSKMFVYAVNNGQAGVAFDDGSKFEYTKEARVVALIGMICNFLRSLQTEPMQAYIPSKTSSHAKRVRKGKKPIYDWKTITVEPPKPRGQDQGGTHASPRWHERRGHWRTMPSGKKVWVKSCEVGDKAKGAVFKDYVIPEAF